MESQGTPLVQGGEVFPRASHLLRARSLSSLILSATLGVENTISIYS